MNKETKKFFNMKKVIKKITIIGDNVIPFEKQTQLEDLNNINLIFGYNGSGKTALTKILKEYNSSKESSKIKIDRLSEKIKFIVFNNWFVKENFYLNEEESNKKLKGCKIKFGSENNIRISNEKRLIEQKIKKTIESIPYKNLPKMIKNYKKESFLHLLKNLEDENTNLKNLTTKFKTRITKSFSKTNIRDMISNIINKKHGSFLDFFVTKKLKSSDFNSNEEELSNLKTRFLSLKEHKDKYLRSGENSIDKIGTAFIENENLLQEIDNLNNFTEKSSNYEKYVDNSFTSYEKFVIKLNKKNEFLLWFKEAMKIYEKEQDLLNQSKCLLCQKNTFNQSNFKNIFKLVNKNLSFKEIEKIVENKNDILEADELIIEEHCEKMKNFEIKNHQNKINDIKSNFEKYKNCFKKIELSFKQINNFRHIKHENLEIKHLIDKINNEIAKNEVEIEKEMQELDKKINELAEKILEKIATKTTKQELDNYTNVKNMLQTCFANAKNWKTKKLESDTKAMEIINHYLKKYFRFHFEIDIKNSENNLYGFISARGQNKEFGKNDLSEGERSILSLLYFLLIECEKIIDENKTNNNTDFIIVIDDPTTSLTYENSLMVVNFLINVMDRISKKHEVQYIFLSHRFNFLTKFKTRLKSLRKAHYIKEHLIEQKKILPNKFLVSTFNSNYENIFFSLYRKYWEDFMKFENDNDAYMVLVFIMRNILESFVFFWSKENSVFKFLENNFNENDFSEYNNLFTFLNNFCHGDRLNISTKSDIDIGEKNIKEQIRKNKEIFIDFFKKNYQKHHEEMTKKTNES